jgi:hypothetical protein
LANWVNSVDRICQIVSCNGVTNPPGLVSRQTSYRIHLPRCDLAGTEGVVNGATDHGSSQCIDAGLVLVWTTVGCLRSQLGREVTRTKSGNGYGINIRGKWIVLPMGLPVEKEECLVALLVEAGDVNRPAKRQAKLVSV